MFFKAYVDSEWNAFSCQLIPANNREIDLEIHTNNYLITEMC